MLISLRCAHAARQGRRVGGSRARPALQPLPARVHYSSPPCQTSGSSANEERLLGPEQRCNPLAGVKMAKSCADLGDKQLVYSPSGVEWALHELFVIKASTCLCQTEPQSTAKAVGGSCGMRRAARALAQHTHARTQLTQRPRTLSRPCTSAAMVGAMSDATCASTSDTSCTPAGQCWHWWCKCCHYQGKMAILRALLPLLWGQQQQQQHGSVSARLLPHHHMPATAVPVWCVDRGVHVPRVTNEPRTHAWAVRAHGHNATARQRSAGAQYAYAQYTYKHFCISYTQYAQYAYP